MNSRAEVADASAQSARRGLSFRLDWAAAALALLLVATAVLRFGLYADRPFWLDEVWTGMIATRRSFPDFVRECLFDANAPLYSCLAALWAQVSGVSDRAIRFLPGVLGCVAPLIALIPQRGVDRAVRLTWCGLIACWIPGIWLSGEARPYTLALALAVANTVAFIELLRQPSQRSAWIWTGLSSLAILTHYFGAVLVAIQGVAYLVVHRQRALRTWPAALAFLPAFAALAAQAHVLVKFSSGQHAWIPRASLTSGLADLWYLVDPVALFGALCWFAAVAVVARRLGPPRASESSGVDAAWVAASCGVLAALTTVLLGFVRPMVVPRYFTEFAPALFLAVSLAAARVSGALRPAPALLVGVFALSVAMWARHPPEPDNLFSWEQASTDLMAQHPSRLVFMWDTPMGGNPSSIAGVGGFFFERAGQPIVVDPVIGKAGEDPNQLLLAHAKAPGSAIIWIYDTGVAHTSAIAFPPRIEALDPDWRCKNYGAGALGIVACGRTHEAAL